MNKTLNKDTLLYINIGVDAFIVLIYGVVITLILILLKKGTFTIQHMLWLDWSAFVLLKIFLYLIDATFMHLYKSPYISVLVHYLSLTWRVILGWFMVTAMAMINLDRLFLVTLNIKYPIYVTRQRVALAIAISWISCIGTCMGIVVIYMFEDPQKIVSTKIMPPDNYIGPTVDVSHIIISIIIYSFIFHRFVGHRRNEQRKKNHVTLINRFKEMHNSFRTSRFYLAFLLVLSYTLFIAIPDMIVIFICCNEILHIIFSTCTRISWTIDAFIFICMDQDIRKWLRRRKAVHALQNAVLQETLRTSSSTTKRTHSL